MEHQNALLESIKQLVASNKYRVRIHSLRHMVEEGFYETNILEAITSKSKILENYPDDNRCLILGRFHYAKAVTSPLHIICDYSRDNLVDIVTAYVPQKPWWVDPTKRGKTL